MLELLESDFRKLGADIEVAELRSAMLKTGLVFDGFRGK